MLKSEPAVRSELNHWRLRIEPRRLSHWVDVSNPLTSGSYTSLPEASASASSAGAGILIYLRPFKDIKATICIPNIWMVGLQHRLGMWPIAFSGMKSVQCRTARCYTSDPANKSQTGFVWDDSCENKRLQDGPELASWLVDKWVILAGSLHLPLTASTNAYAQLKFDTCCKTPKNNQDKAKQPQHKFLRHSALKKSHLICPG